MTEAPIEAARRPRLRPGISVVVPVFNEERNVPVLYAGLVHALLATRRSFEILFVDDGSTDATRRTVRALAASDPRVRGLLFRRNYGQTAAMAAGFAAARGDIVVSMDGDLQNDPADIPRLIERLEQGYDIVCGWRRHRRDRYSTRLLPSRLANWLIQRVTGVPIHDTGCSLKAYRGWVIRGLDLYSEMHRFIAALATGLGARVAELPVRHHARRFGRSKYGLGRIFRVLVDLIVIKMVKEFAAHPLRGFGLLALPLLLLSPVLFFLGTFHIGSDGIWPESHFDSSYVTGGTLSLVVAFNVFLLGFIAELQVKVSEVFRRRIALTTREARA
jgi:glycosyltransferase involved in cell wall biosynthesis